MNEQVMLVGLNNYNPMFSRYKIKEKEEKHSAQEMVKEEIADTLVEFGKEEVFSLLPGGDFLHSIDVIVEAMKNYGIDLGSLTVKNGININPKLLINPKKAFLPNDVENDDVEKKKKKKLN